LDSFTDLYFAMSPRYPELSGKVALVTGSGRGIGRGIAARLGREGMRVILHDRFAAELEGTAGQFRAAGAEVAAIAADLSQPGEAENLAASALQAYGQIDLLINNAADLRRTEFLKIDEALLDYQLALNLKAPFLLSLRIAEAMKNQGQGGCIIHISSVGGLRAHWSGLPYDATKSALDSMTRAMAIDLASAGIRVNSIAPGLTISERTPQRINGHPAEAMINRIPARRPASVHDIAGAAAFLASPDAAYITGQVLYVDGGLTAQLSPRGQDV
jgi:3-oxoacyl-[acyl-carrier protein] reductase